MVRFKVGQKWITKDGKLHGEIAEISDDGRRGAFVVTDDNGNCIDRHSVTAAEIQGPGQWQLAA
jgi:hypothetical protein